MQIVGICRFSYLATRGWRGNVPDDVQATSELLYTKERMEERFLFFENVCLPSVAEQVDKDFKFMIIASFRMPEEYRDRLEKMVAPYENVVIQYLKPRLMAEAVTIALRRTVDRTSDDPVVQFCLDDDDAVSIYYVERLRKAVTSILSSDFVHQLPIAYNNPRGITLSKKGGKFAAHENFAPFLALGLAIITKSDISTNAYKVPHLKTTTRLFAVSDPNPMTYLRGLHDFHDSRGISKGRQNNLTEETLTKILDREFPFISVKKVFELFGKNEGFENET